MILLFLVIYFVVLFVERVLAVILSINQGGEYALLSGNAFNYIAYGVTAISVAAGLVLMIKVLPKMLISIFSGKEYDFDANCKIIIIAAMTILYGGMMHTGFTLAPIQFVAYGALILSMIVRTMECCKKHKEKAFASIVSVIYLTLFAMAVPVSYISFQNVPMRIVFYIVEFAAVFVLVPIFGKLTFDFYKTGVTSFSFVYPLIMLILSGLTVVLKWTEEINWFVLVFVVLTIVFYLSFGLIVLLKKRNN